jgi:hypothetical protein
MKSAKVLFSLAIVGGLLQSAALAEELPPASQILKEIGMPDDTSQRVLAGEFVTADVKPVSERDLSVAIAFLVKTTPADLSKQVVAGDFISADPQVKQHGEFKGGGSLAALTPLQITGGTAKTFAGAKAGSDLNLSKTEIASFSGLAEDDSAAVLDKLHEMLLKRYQSYRASGLAGIPAYDRGGKTSDPAADLRSATNAQQALKKYLPSFQKVLLDYPKAKVEGMNENFYWFAYDISGKPTYVLSHVMVAPDGDAAIVMQRQYYVSTGYNAEQAVAGFLPVKEGTVVVYVNHTFTDQVAGFGGSMKRGIGRNMMESQLKKLFDKARSTAR